MGDIVADVEAKIAALKLRLPDLEGKANKRERTAVNKEIYNLENDEAYVAAVKAQLEGARSEVAAADDKAHLEKLMSEEAAVAERNAAAMAKRLEAQNDDAPADVDEECHMEIIKVLKKGDEETYPKPGESVSLTYRGRFAEGTTHGGVDYSGKEFDTTWDAKRKQHKPLTFQMGANRVIRGWEEALKAMSLGQSLEISVGPKWAYRKGGVQDDNGAYVIPPNATLLFQMELAAVGGKKAAG